MYRLTFISRTGISIWYRHAELPFVDLSLLHRWNFIHPIATPSHHHLPHRRRHATPPAPPPGAGLNVMVTSDVSFKQLTRRRCDRLMNHAKNSLSCVYVMFSAAIRPTFPRAGLADPSPDRHQSFSLRRAGVCHRRPLPAKVSLAVLNAPGGSLHHQF